LNFLDHEESDDDTSDEIEDESADETVDEYDQFLEVTEPFEEDQFAAIEFDEIAGSSYPCAAHNLQLCLFHSIKITLAEEKAFKKLLKLQKSFSHSQQARSDLKQGGGKLYKKFCRTRWANSIDLVSRYLEIKGRMTQVCILNYYMLINYPFRLQRTTVSLIYPVPTILCLNVILM